MFFLKKQHYKILIPAFAVLFVYACTNPKSRLGSYGPLFENVMRTDIGAYRGFNLGEKIDSVQKKEVNKPLEVDNGYLYYEYKVNDDGSFNITYNFDERGLNEIQSDIFINDAKKTDEVYNSFKSYFDESYGTSQTDMGYEVWSVKSEKYGDVKISLSDASADFTVKNAPGKISLWIYPDKN